MKPEHLKVYHIRLSHYYDERPNMHRFEILYGRIEHLDRTLYLVYEMSCRIQNDTERLLP